ncbi:MAG: Cof-type HAD-IIB family hydrolase [Candidatus Coproplasma sp.]
MTKLNCKLIVSDCDGTLLNSEHTVSDKVRASIDKFVADGGIFAVCTGRMTASILPQVRALGLKGLVAAYQGGVIAEIESGKLIRNSGFTGAQAAEICKALEDMGAYVNAYFGDEMYSDIPADNEYLKIYEKITGITARHAAQPLSEYAANSNRQCQKVASLCFPQDRENIYSCLKEKFAGKYDVTCSAEVLVEIAPIGDDKGSAVKFLASHYGVPIEKTVAIGDNLNDLSMIKAAGIGVAVGNAVQELKDSADFISVTNDEGAVAQVIEKFGYADENRL